MKTKFFFLLLSVVIFLVGCEKDSNKKLIYHLNEADTLTSDDYEIYNLIANPYETNLEIIFIDQKTGNVTVKNVAGLDSVLYQNYESKKNDYKYLDEDSFSNENNVKLIPANEVDRNIFNEIYDSSSSRYLSNIGYNENHTEAIVGAVDRWDCAETYYLYYLKKENNRWIKVWSLVYTITCL